MNTRIRRHLGSVLLALAACGLAACGGAGGSDGTTLPPAGNAGPAGATVQSVDGNATLEVPAGALTSTIDVKLAAAANGGYTSDPQLVPGTVYQVDAPDTALAKPATLSFTLPAGTVAPSSAARKHAQAVVRPQGYLGCELWTHLQSSPDTPLPIPAGIDLPPSATNPDGSELVCLYDPIPWPQGGCPPGFNQVGSGILQFPSYFTPQNPGTFPPGSNSGRGGVSLCKVTPVPQPQVATLTLNNPIALRPTLFNPATNKASINLNALKSGAFGVLMDVTPPVVKLSTTITPVSGTNLATIRLSVAATDNVGVKSVSLVRWNLQGATISSGALTINRTALASFSAPPYQWESAPLPLDQIYGFDYLAVASDAAGNIGTANDTPVQGVPAIAAFAATPAAVPAGGGDVTLAWSASNANTLSIDQGIGDVSGLASKPVHVSAPTTFTLTATNTSGSVTATTSVTVLPQPAPTITSFTATPATLPAGGGNVTLAWTTTDAATLSIDNGVGAVTGTTSKVVGVGASTTFLLTATNGGGSVTQQASVVVATGTDRFVDTASAGDALPCAQAAPCRNIATAMSGAPTGTTVYLADGIYDTTNQPATSFTMPNGVTLRATHADAVTLQGLVITMAGGGGFNGVRLEGNAQVLATSSVGGSVTLTGVRVRGSGGWVSSGASALTFSGNVVASMSPGSLAGGECSMGSGLVNTVAAVRGSAQFTIQGCTFDGHAADGFSPLFAVLESGTLTLDATTMTHLAVANASNTGIVSVGNNGATGTATLTLQNGTVLSNVRRADNSAYTVPGIVVGHNANVVLDQATISDLAATAILGAGSSLHGTSVTVRNGSTISQAARALSLDLSGGGTTALTINGASFTGNASGMRLTGDANTTVDVNQLTYTGNATAQAAGTLDNQFTVAKLKVRNSTIGGNGGVGLLLGNPAGSTASLDLGTAASPGNNVFSSNAGVNLYVLVNGTQTVDAAGNTWEASAQGADAAGKYPAGTQKTGAQSGKNFTTNAGTTLNL